jgi:hypothetical protein
MDVAFQQALPAIQLLQVALAAGRPQLQSRHNSNQRKSEALLYAEAMTSRVDEKSRWPENHTF